MDNTIITVESTKLDGYGNLMVTHKGGGKDIKIGEKRKQLFAFFSEGAAVELIWDSFKNRDYVADAKLVEGSLPAPKQPIKTEATPKPQKTREQEIAEHVWWKELGNRIGDGSLEKDYPNKAVMIKHEYYKKMSEVIGVSFK